MCVCVCARARVRREGNKERREKDRGERGSEREKERGRELKERVEIKIEIMRCVVGVTNMEMLTSWEEHVISIKLCKTGLIHTKLVRNNTIFLRIKFSTRFVQLCYAFISHLIKLFNGKSKNILFIHSYFCILNL